MNAAQARIAMTEITAGGAELHGGFILGDVVQEFALLPLPLGIWAIPEPTLTKDIQLNNFVSSL